MKRILGLLVVALGISLATAAPAPAVVNGTDAVSNPGAVSLWTMNPYRNRCTGTLLEDGDGPGSRWVMTAAHCATSLFAETAGGVEARIGAVDNTTGGDYIAMPVVSYQQHEDYDPNTLRSDMMLLELRDPVDAPAMLWHMSELPLGGVGTVNGYGWVCDGPAGQTCSSWYQGPLQRYLAKVLPDSDCVTVVDPRQVCTESATGAYQSACLGDSGAPGSTKAFNGYEWVHVLRFMVLGDGDDWSGASCITAPDGDNGRSVGLAIHPYKGWIWDQMHGADLTPATVAPSWPMTDREYDLVG